MKRILFFLALSLIALPFLSNASNPPASPKVIALSFDDGPNGKYTREVLAILKENNAKVTFFVIGKCAIDDPKLLKDEFDAGHAVENHTYSHPNLSKLSDAGVEQQLEKTNKVIYDAIGVYPTLFRPPYGECGDACKAVAAKLGLKKITWDFMPNDWDYKKTTAEILAAKVIKHAHSGAIIAMHDGGGNRSKSVAALAIIITTLKKEGYSFVTIPQIISQ